MADSETSGASSSKRKKKTQTEDDDDDETPLPIIINVYLYIPKKMPTVTTKIRGKAAAPEDLEKGPFELLATDTYPIFLFKLAKALPCRPENIHESKIRWKPKKPKNEDKLTLGKDVGYKAMIKVMAAKKEELRTLFLYMPAPAEPMEDDTVRPSIY